MGQWPKNRLQAYMPMEFLEGKREFTFPDIRGFEVLNTTGHRVGEVKNIFVDPNTLEPRFAYLKYQKFLNTNVKALLVPWEELILTDNAVQTRWTEEELLPETVAHQQRHLEQRSRAAGHDMDETEESYVEAVAQIPPQ